LSTLIAVSGKGGVGKTAVTALILKCLIETCNEEKNILVVDADPDANLAETIGVNVDVKKTVGYIATEFKKLIAQGKLPPSIDKGAYLESRVLESVIELDRFDMLVMWRTEGEGCYCFVNEVLSRAIEWLMDGYDIVLMDCEAGLEHFNRRVFKEITHLIIVVDGSRHSFDTALRIKSVIDEVGIKVENMWIVGNRIPKQCYELVEKRCRELGIPLLGIIPLNETLFQYYIEGVPLLKLPSNHEVVNEVRKMLRKINLIP